MLPPILIDTREQLPYEFEGYHTERFTLHTGDYSILGSESACAVERKTKEDAWQCVGASRGRFTDCLVRLANLKRAVIVIECPFDSFCLPPARTRLNTAQAVGSYISWEVQYGIPVKWFTREQAERFTLRWLMSWYKHFVVAQEAKSA